MNEMPRQARLDAPGALHHIMFRGNNKADIFRDDLDRERFVDRLGETVTKCDCRIYAWALMENHVHILLRSGPDGVSAVMRKLLTGYAQYFNRRHQRTGHLFENRYKSILCDEERYFLALVRYIHLNPMRGGLAKTMEGLDAYRWCGHGAILGRFTCPGMDAEYVLARFGASRKRSRRRYRTFIREGMGRRPATEGDKRDSIRSPGGWSQVQAVRHRDESTDLNDRILGDENFVWRVMKEVDARRRRELRSRRSGTSIENIIEEECRKGGITAGELTGGSIRRRVSAVRAAIGLRGRDELGLSAAEMARFVGVGTSGMTRSIERIGRRVAKGHD